MIRTNWACMPHPHAADIHVRDRLPPADSVALPHDRRQRNQQAAWSAAQW